MFCVETCHCKPSADPSGSSFGSWFNCVATWLGQEPCKQAVTVLRTKKNGTRLWRGPFFQKSSCPEISTQIAHSQLDPPGCHMPSRRQLEPRRRWLAPGMGSHPKSQRTLSMRPTSTAPHAALRLSKMLVIICWNLSVHAGCYRVDVKRL